MKSYGYDGKAIKNDSTAQVVRDGGETSDPDAHWGEHETGGMDARTAKPEPDFEFDQCISW